MASPNVGAVAPVYAATAAPGTVPNEAPASDADLTETPTVLTTPSETSPAIETTSNNPPAALTTPSKNPTTSTVAAESAPSQATVVDPAVAEEPPGATPSAQPIPARLPPADPASADTTTADTTTAGTTTADTTPGDADLPLVDARGQRLPPLASMISSPFGRRRIPGWLSRRGLVMRNHSGLDLRARLGWPVIAFKDGTVTIAQNMGTSGLVVEIVHDGGLRSRYAHLGTILVPPGRQVKTGEQVGLVGCTGRTTGAHLHFALKNTKGVFIDPLPYLHSADQVLAPLSEQIPDQIASQQCRPTLKSPQRLSVKK